MTVNIKHYMKEINSTIENNVVYKSVVNMILVVIMSYDLNRIRYVHIIMSLQVVVPELTLSLYK